MHKMLRWHSPPVLVVLLAFLATQHSVHARELTGVAGTSGRRLQQTCDSTQYAALTPTITRAPLVDLSWLDPADQNILGVTKRVGVEAGGLWASSDGGKTWAEKTAALNSTVPASEAVEITAIFSKKSAPANVVLLGAGTWYWTSNDYGQTFRALQTPSKWRGMSVRFWKEHPTKEDWLLLLVKRPECRALDRAQMQCPHDLMLTQDLYSGNPTWSNLTDRAGGKIAGFVDFDWGYALCPKGVDCPANIQETTILATMYAHPGDYDQPWDPDVHFVSSAAWFASFTTQVRCGNMFEVIGRSVYLAMANSCPTDITGKQRHDVSPFPQGITLFTSQDGGASFNQACLPIALKQEGYELMETHDGTGVVLVVDYLITQNLPASSVYTAGPHHALFSLSLSDVAHADYSFGTDFARIEGLPGVYIANQMLARPDQGGPGDDDYYDLSDLTDTPLVETRITYNGGARWQRIPAPTGFANPACNRCGGSAECYLHLHGMTSWASLVASVPAVYSNPSAPGLILATGNTAVKGVGLDDQNGLCTWMSSDGGVTWRDVAVGPYIYEFADWGGFVILARHPGGNIDRAVPAEEVLFSYDGGKCWGRVALSEALLVDNIRIEPDGQRPRVLVHGRRCRSSQNPACGYKDHPTGELPGGMPTEGLIYALDLQDLLGSKMGQCVEVDRQLWSIPNDLGGSTPRCVLGRQTQVQRRRWDAACFNGPDWKRPAPIVTPCNCTVEADLECDYGYVRTGTECQALPAARMPTCPVVESGKYLVSSTGKRLVHADTCQHVEGVLPDTDGKGTAQPGGGSKPPPKPSPAPGPTPSGGGHSGWWWLLITLLVVVGVAGGFVAWWVYLASEDARDTVRDLAAGVADHLYTAKQWVQEKIKGRRSPLVAEHDLGYMSLGETHEAASEETPLFTLR